MKPIINLLAVLVFLIGSTGSLYSQNAEQQYQKGLMQEEGEGNLQEAIKIFAGIVENQNADQSLQAKALLHVGLCYEKMGKEEATKAYQKLVNNFPSQKNEVAIARERLSKLILAVEKLAQKEKSKDLVIRKFMEGTGAEFYGAPSPNGKYFAFVDFKTSPNDIVIKDIETGKEVRLRNQTDVNYQGDQGIPYNPIWSPDSKQLAYVWENDKDNSYKLFVIEIENPKPEVLIKVGYNNGWIKTEDWSSDGKYILAQLTENNQDQLGLISTKDGSFQVLKKIGKTAPYSAKFSPDGKYIAYDNPPNEENAEHDIFVIQIDGKIENRITYHPSHDYFLNWSPSGEKILFASNRTGTNDMWSISFSGGSGQKTPELVSENIGNIKALGTTNEGSFYYSTPGSWWDIYTTTVEPESGKFINTPTELPLPFQGYNRHPGWSPDGKYLAYVSVRRHLRKPNILCIYSKETGAVKEFANVKDVNRPVWFPNSQSVLLFGTDVLNITTGKIESVIPLQKDDELEKFALSISSDSESIYYETRNKNWDKHSIIQKDLESSEEKELYTASDDNLTMSLSPDNKQLALLQRHNENTRILKIVSITDSSEKIIHTFKQDDFGYIDLSWSPNGKYIYFSKKADADWVLCRIPVTGGVVENLNVHKNLFTSISIHPNGQLITFSSFVGKEKPGGIWVMENFLPSENEETAAKEPEGIKIRQIWQAPYLDDLGTVSLDGKYRSYVDWGVGNLGIHNLKTDEKKVLTSDAKLGEAWQYAGSTVISKDGKRIVYSWANPYNTNALRLTNVENPKPELLYKKTGEELYPTAWLSDKEIVAFRYIPDTRTMQLVTFNIMDKKIRVKKTFPPGQFGGGLACSPDEKYIAYGFANSADNGNTDIRLVQANEDRDIPLITHPSNDKVLGWVPGRKEFLFISDRSDSWDLWAIKLDDTKPLGPAKRIYADIGDVSSMGFTRDGECYFGFSRRNFYSGLAPFNKETGEIDLGLGQAFESQNFGTTWSPDGQHLAYIKIEDNSKGNPYKLFVQDVKTGEKYQPGNNMLRVRSYKWSPDGKSILVVGREINKLQEKDYKGGIFMVDIKTGQIEQILLLSEYEFNRPEDDSAPLSRVEWSSDKRSFYFLFQKDRLVNHNLETGEEKILYRYSDFTPYVLETSPDGKNLLFGLDYPGEEKSRLLTMPAEGGKEKMVCTSQEASGVIWAKYSPDGKYIYFVELPEFNRSVLWRVPAEGGKPEKIWSPEKRVEIYDIHPDGNQVAFSIRERTTEVRVIEGLVNELNKIYSQNE
ncbi:tetratricopeptide repeat protein [Draconibacterium sp.]|nr:tetratricopeptide repeat protein [Draconibacterium sp.]